MAQNPTKIVVDIDDAKDVIDQLPDAIDDGATRAIRQLSVLAEGELKSNAPEGAGRDIHMRETIRTQFSRNGLRATIGPRKRVGGENILLADILADDPEWTDENRPEGDNPIPLSPLMAWTGAKWGDPTVAAAARLAHSLVDDGMQSAPNDWVEDSFDDWKTQVEDIAGDELRDSIARLTAGGV
jgi:hypothetical protein